MASFLRFPQDTSPLRTLVGDWCKFVFASLHHLRMWQDKRSTHSNLTNCHQLPMRHTKHYCGCCSNHFAFISYRVDEAVWACYSAKLCFFKKWQNLYLCASLRINAKTQNVVWNTKNEVAYSSKTKYFQTFSYSLLSFKNSILFTLIVENFDDFKYQGRVTFFWSVGKIQGLNNLPGIVSERQKPSTLHACVEEENLKTGSQFSAVKPQSS